MKKRLTHKEIEKIDWNLAQPITSEQLDEERCLAWGSYMGILLGDFLNMIERYCLDRGRKYFVALNNWGAPTVFFDVDNQEELDTQWEEEREQYKKLSEHKTKDFLNPKRPN